MSVKQSVSYPFPPDQQYDENYNHRRDHHIIRPRQEQHRQRADRTDQAVDPAAGILQLAQEQHYKQGCERKVQSFGAEGDHAAQQTAEQGAAHPVKVVEQGYKEVEAAPVHSLRRLGCGGDGEGLITEAEDQEKALSAGNFGNFDEVMAAWDNQIRYYTRKSIEIEYVVDTMLEENVHDILCSALVDDCIERAKSIKQGGAKYDWVSGLQVGIANLGNSLAAVKKLVFDQGVIGQQQLAAALADDFEGLTHEQLRQRLINGAPKYGNDDDSVDLLLTRAYQTYIEELKQYHNPRYGRGPIGGNYYAGTSSISANVPFGAATMATPDGRKAHTPLAEGASPASGTDHLGPTAVIGSVGKLPTEAILGGVLLNQKLNPSTLENDSDRQKLMVLLRTFFEVHKGWHIQYNIVSRETLLEAKKHPDQYRDLVVRVAGYSAFFTALSPDAQDDIIARTEHTL